MDVYIGEFVDSMRHGKGIMRFANGDRYEGEFEKNMFHGFGFYAWNNTVNEYNEPIVNRKYEGDWVDGKYHGRGVYSSGVGDVYSGYFANGLYQGNGVLKHKNGDTTRGSWSRGHPNGDVKITFHNGDLYVGQMLNGKKHGKGKFTFCNEKGYYEGTYANDFAHGRGVRIYLDGSKYVGEYSEGEIHGEGMMFYANGDQYLGQWVNGHKDGKGVLRMSYGDSYEGHFKNGAFYGEGKYVYADGGYYSGEFRNVRKNKHSEDPDSVGLPLTDGHRHGFGIRVFTSGTRYEGQWENDRMNGQGSLRTVEGATFEGNFFNGTKHGKGREEFGNELGIKFCCPLGYWHAGNNYCVYTGDYAMGLFHGEGEFKCQAGPYYKGQWCRGKKHGQGEVSYFKDGEQGDQNNLYIGGVGSLYRLKGYEGAWENNVREGKGRQTFSNGDYIDGEFRNGHPHGEVKYFFRKSGKIRYAIYENGYRTKWLDKVYVIPAVAIQAVGSKSYRKGIQKFSFAAATSEQIE